MIRSFLKNYRCRPTTCGRARREISLLGIAVCVLVFVLNIFPAYAQEAITQAPPPAANTAPPSSPAPQDPAAAPQPDKKIVNNPFTPGGVTTSEQTITRKEVLKLIADMEARLKRELSGDINSEEINKLIQNAAGGMGGAGGPANMIGCVNGVPLYRDDEGSLTLGTKEPEELKKQRCGS